MTRRAALRQFVFIALMSPALLAAACHSYHIETTLENRTGNPIKLLEVDYPSASFGADALAAGANLRYRIVVLDSGPVTITYTGSDDKQVKIKGIDLFERQQGSLEIVLLPNGKAEFHPHLTPAG